jgi:hypothetical protein
MTVGTFHTFAADTVTDLEPGCLDSVTPTQKLTGINSSSVSCPNCHHNTEVQLMQLEVPPAPMSRALPSSITVHSVPLRCT